MIEVCDVCGGEIITINTPNSVHYAKRICQRCGKWFKWLTDPENTNKRMKTSKFKIENILKYHNYDKEFCFFCLRERKQLGFNETMTIDHIREINKGGKDEIENLQILCSACHKLKNWARLYINWHHLSK